MAESRPPQSLANRPERCQDPESLYCLKDGLFFDETSGPYYDEEARMPYASDPERIGEGASGIVYSLKIMKGHLTTNTGHNTELVTRVRKEFRDPKARDNFLAENDFLKRISDRSQQPDDNIMTPLQSYAVGTPPVYNIVFDTAMCSLSTYLSDTQKFPDGKTAERLKNVSRMIGVATGLKWLSESFEYESDSGRYEEMHAFHRDLRPENILVCRREQPHGGSGELVFKISDFGRALRRATSTVGSQSSKCKDSNQRTNIGGTYAAPESNQTNKSDVWSFGCVLLAILTFNYEGVHGLNEFMISLIRESRIDGFYNPKSHKANNETANCIQYLQVRSESESDKLVTWDLLKLLEERVFIPANKRAGIGEAEESMKKAYNKKDLVAPKIKFRTHAAIQKGVRHCAQSPGGKFEMFHPAGDTYGLVVYHNDLCTPLPILGPISAPKQKEPKCSRRIYPRSSSCSYESICQVISNKAPIELSLYMIPDRPGVTLRRQFVSLTEIPSISRVAVSPSSQLLAMDCFTGSAKNFSVLRLFDIIELSKQMSRVREMPPCDTLPEGISPEGISGVRLDLLREQPLKRPAGLEAEALCFSGDSRHLYHVTKAKSSVYNGKLDFQIKVAIWDVEKKNEICTKHLNKQDLDCEEFLTCFTPFNRTAGFIAITCRRFITRCEVHSGQHDDVCQPETEPFSTGEAAKDLLKAVVLAPDDSFAIFLGGEYRLTMYIAKRKDKWNVKRLEVENAARFIYEVGKDAASIMSDENLLISYKNGRSVTFNLEVALTQ